MKKKGEKTISVEVNDKMTTEEKVESLTTALVLLAKTVKGLQEKLNETRRKLNSNTEDIEMLLEATSNIIDYIGAPTGEEDECDGSWMVDLIEDKEDDEEEPTVCPCCGNIE